MKKEVSTKEGNETNESEKQLFCEYQKDFNAIKDKFTLLSDFIIDIEFYINIGEVIKRRDIIV